MPREWPFSARSAAWRTRCTRGDAPRLLTQATGAFVDRRAIDWTALRARVLTPRQRALVENLRHLESLRGAHAGACNTLDFGPAPLSIVWWLTAGAALQALCSLTVLGLALASGDATAYRTSPTVIALAFTVAGAVLGVASRRDPRGLLLVATLAAAASAFGRAAVAGVPETYAAAIAPLLVGLYPEAFMPACLWQFALDFPRMRRFTRFDVLARRVAAGAWVVGTLLFGLNLFAAYRPVDGPSAYLLRDDPRNMFWSLFALAQLPAMAAILVRSRRAGAAERREVTRFAVGIAAGTAPLLLCGVARLLLPPFNDWLLRSNAPQVQWVHGVIVGSLIATPIAGTIAAMVDRPFEIHAPSRAAWRARLLRGGVAAVALMPFAILLSTIFSLRHLPLVEVFSWKNTLWLLACAAAGALLLPARQRVLNALNRRGFTRSDDPHERLVSALERVRNARGTREITAVLTRELRQAVGVRVAGVLVPERDRFVDATMHVSWLGSDAVLPAMLRETRRPLALASDRPLFNLMPRLDREWLLANEVELAAALKHRDGTIAAVAVLGGKRNGRRFTRRDSWLVTALTTAAATAWDAAAPVGSEHADQIDGSADQVALECKRCGLVSDSRPLPCHCGIQPVLASLPRHLGRKFLVERRLGAGATGVVYLARDESLDRHVALKTLPSLSGDTVARLRAEARMMADLNHDAVATLYGLEVWRRTPVLVVEYFPGGTLADRLVNGPMSTAAALRMGKGLARALVYLHGKRVLHCDIKPSNIGFAATDAPKLLDFGLMTRTAGGSGPYGGTPAYMPPEAHEGSPPAPGFDLWALSVVLIEAIAGRNPFAARDVAATTQRILTATFAEICCLLPDLPPGLIAFFNRALARTPGSRFPTAVELLSALTALEAHVVDRGAGRTQDQSSFPSANSSS